MSSSDLLSGHPKDQVSDLCQPELNVESTDLVTMQDNPNPDGNVFSNQEKVLFEDEDSKSVKTQQSEMISNLEDSAMEYRESTRVREELETSQMQLETETVGQEELSQQTDYDVSIPVPHDGTSNLAITHSGLQNPTPANYPEKNLESPIPESENLQDHGVNEGELRVEECNESMLVPLEGMDTSGTFQDEDTRGAYHSEDAFHDQDVTLPAQTQEKHELDSAGQSVKQSPNISKEMVLSNLIEEAEVSDINQPELTIKSSFDRPSKQEDFPLYDRLEDHPAKSTISEAFEQANDDHHPGENVTETHEDEVKPTQMPEEDENIWSTVKEGDSSVQALQAEINVPSDSESQHMNPNGNPIRNRRKLGSSRRSKRQQHVENIVTETLHEPKEECVQKRSNDEAFDVKATEMSSSDLLSGHPKDQVSDLCQPELNVESTDLVTMQDNPNPDGNVFSNQEKVLFEDEDSKSVKTQQSEMISNLEDSAIDYRESTRGREELETSQMQLGTETVGQEELSQQTDYDVSIPVPHDGTSNLAITHSGLQNPTPANYPEKNLESPIPESENLQDHGVNEGELRVEECNESMLVPLEGMDTSGTFQDEDTRGAYHSEDAFHDQDVTLPAQTQEKHELDSAGQSVKQSPNISKEMVLSNLIEEAEVSDINQPELTIKSSFDRPSKQEDFPLYDRLEDHPAKSTISEAFEQANDDHHPGENVTETHEDEVKPTQMPEEDENIWSTVKEGDSSVQALQAEINVPSDSESQHMNPNGNPIRNRRKLGSSRRSKRQQHVENIVTETLHESKEECVQKRSNDEALNIKATEISSAIDKKKEGEPEEDFKLNPPIKVRNDNGNTGLVLSQNVKDDNVGQKEGYNDLDNLSQLTELVQSPALKDYLDTENIPCHDDIDFIRPFSSDPFEQEDDYHIQNKEPSPYDKDKIIITQQTNDTVETVGHVMFDDYKTEADTEVDVPVSGNEEVENFKDLVKRDQDTENIMALREITASPQSGLFSTTHKTESLAPLDTNPVVNLKAEQAVDVAEENGSENLQEKSKQKKRKFGSNRRILFKGNLERVQESKDETKKREFDAEADLRSLEKMKVMEDIPRLVSAEVEKQLETQETISHLDLGQILQGSTCDPQSLENDIISDKNLATENSANSNMTGENSVPLDETTLCSQSTAERPESAIVLQHQALKSATELVVAGTDLEIVTTEVNKGGEEQNNTESSIQESNKVDEEVHNTNLEMKNASPNLTHRRRKMGSTRKNLKSKTKEDGLHQKQEIDNEATEATTNAEDVKTDYFSGNKEEDSEPKVEHGDDDSEQKKAIVLEQAEFSHISDSHLTPTALGTSEDNLEPNSKIEHQLTPDYLPAKQSTTPELDAMPEATSSGRRRKFGSNRKTRGQQSNKNQTVREEKIIETESGSDGEGVTDESAVKTNEKKTSEVENTKEEASPGISTLKGGDNSAPKSEKKSQQVTRVQQPSAGIHQSQEGQKTFSLVNSKEAVNRSNSYNVVMVGDSCVGKTAFMKRAVVGKFSTDLPASCGIDTCLGTVVVDGKVVMLQLWDTAGQERFQSITRQIFHRAQAFLLMYDITSSHSFSAVSYWASCIQDGAAEDVTVLLLGNKSDLTDRQVTFQEGETLAKEHNFYFMECSAATGENVIQSLESVARMLSQKADTREETTVLLKEPQKKKSSRCC
ncbi:uncharacterized protein rab44 [Cheilinus undulatus]|uniref:uncharacterized protein rab44 n=1 Tax=Cheilinus undulatus TaxID=241271 RepID=UPI001BD60F4F|nr:uncharacterized protein rab44 [Cheilinus undulatus]XP_041638228.1 uncharacterized protein rab44 [Cheilinus undulatus]XP_041638237.1 uncharacterized protein rab44 [Cheilinus undulatus]